MKKVIFFWICSVLLSSCSMSVQQLFLVPVATSTPAPTYSNTPTNIPSATPTIPTPTFTGTPTLEGLKTATHTPAFTPTTVLSETPLFLLTPNTVTPSVEMKGFISVVVSDKEFYKTAGCGPTSVKFTAQAGDPLKTSFVVLSVRFKSKQSGVTSKWTGITMQTLGAGTFTHDLLPEEMKNADAFKDPWIQYQFVATDSKTLEIGRTAVFSERLTLLECEPTPIPSLIPTPTVLKP